MHRCPIRLVGLGVSVLVLAIGCGTVEPPTGPSVPVSPAPATVTGLITGQIPMRNRLSQSYEPIAGATVEVVEGLASGTVAVSDSLGLFKLSVPPGGLRLRVSSSNYQTWESASLLAVAQQATEITTVLLKTAPWALSGQVTDGLGGPFSGIVIEVFSGDAWASKFGTLTTDASGRYRLTSTQPHFGYVTLYVSGAAVDPVSSVRVDCCADNGDTIHDMRLPRVVDVRIDGPSTIRVGETVELPAATITYDDGTTRAVFLLLTSNSPDVVSTGRGNTGYTISGLSEGVARIVTEYRGVPATIDVRVEG